MCEGVFHWPAPGYFVKKEVYFTQYCKFKSVVSALEKGEVHSQKITWNLPLPSESHQA